MSKRWIMCVVTATGLCALSPAFGQGFTLPEGPGKDTVAALCGGCHDINRLGAGYTPAGWQTVMRMMINFGPPIPPHQLATITEYLTKSFPEKPRPAAAVISGPAEIAIRQWQVATPGSRPHDPLATRDGAIWYT